MKACISVSLNFIKYYYEIDSVIIKTHCLGVFLVGTVPYLELKKESNMFNVSLGVISFFGYLIYEKLLLEIEISILNEKGDLT